MTLVLHHAAAGAMRAMPKDSRANDRWFRHFAIVVRDMPQAFDRLKARGVARFSSEPQTLPEWNPASAGIAALYFRDPDGHPLELIHFPAGKGKPDWRRSGSDLFMGVDHIAIVVADTESSLGFYRDRLGLDVVAEASNHGAEQAALSGLPVASVLVTSLIGRGSLGLELLEYLEPRDGRPIPPDTASNDLWWAETLIEAPGSGAQHLRDPDGHGVALGNFIKEM